MRRPSYAWAASLAAVTLGTSGCAGETSGVVVTQAWARPAVDQGTASAVYLHLTNLGDQPDRLLGAESPLAEAVELHSTSLEGDMAHMMPVAGIDLPPGATVVLEPGGGHLMVVNLAGPLAPGDRLPLILLFEMAGDVELDAEVREP